MSKTQVGGVELDAPVVHHIPVSETLYAVLYTEGEIDMEALKEECYRERWVPLMALQSKADAKAPPVLLCFRDAGLAVDFIRINLPDGWIPGLISLPWQEIAHVRSLGWDIDIVTYRKRKVMNHPQYSVCSVIYRFVEEPTYHQKGSMSHEAV